MNIEKGEVLKTVVVNTMCSLGCVATTLVSESYFDKISTVIIGALIGSIVGSLLGLIIVKYLSLEVEYKIKANQIISYFLILILCSTAASGLVVMDDENYSLFRLIFSVIISGYFSVIIMNSILTLFEENSKIMALVYAILAVLLALLLTYSLFSYSLFLDGELQGQLASYSEFLDAVRENKRMALFNMVMWLSFPQLISSLSSNNLGGILSLRFFKVGKATPENTIDEK